MVIGPKAYRSKPSIRRVTKLPSVFQPMAAPWYLPLITAAKDSAVTTCTLPKYAGANGAKPSTWAHPLIPPAGSLNPHYLLTAIHSFLHLTEPAGKVAATCGCRNVPPTANGAYPSTWALASIRPATSKHPFCTPTGKRCILCLMAAPGWGKPICISRG